MTDAIEPDPSLIKGRPLLRHSLINSCHCQAIFLGRILFMLEMRVKLMNPFLVNSK